MLYSDHAVTTCMHVAYVTTFYMYRSQALLQMDNDRGSQYSSYSDEETWSQSNTHVTNYATPVSHHTARPSSNVNHDPNHVTPVSHHIARPSRHLFAAGNAGYPDSYYPPYQYCEFPDTISRAPPQFSMANLMESNSKLMEMFKQMSERITKIEETLKSDSVSSSSSIDAASKNKKRISAKLSVRMLNIMVLTIQTVL